MRNGWQQQVLSSGEKEGAMDQYRYTECGLDNVFIRGLKMIKDDAGEDVFCIPNVNGLHKAIAQTILERNTGISGQELRYLRTEMGLTQAALASVVHREPLAISRWERSEQPIDSNAETIIRLYAAEKLGIPQTLTVGDIAKRCVPTAGEEPIAIDGSDPKNYRPTQLEAA